MVTDEQIRAEYNKMLSQSEIANNLGVTQSYIASRMRKIGLKPWYSKSKYKKGELQETVLEKIDGKCVSMSELVEKVDKDNEDSIRNAIRKLRRKGIIKTFSFHLSGIKGNPIKYHDLVKYEDINTQENLIYRSGKEKLLGLKIVTYLNKGLSIGQKRSLNRRLVSDLPPDAAQIIRNHLFPKTYGPK
mgnify:CR=1 FL=1